MGFKNPNAAQLYKVVEEDVKDIFTGEFKFKELLNLIKSLSQLAEKLLNVSGIEKRRAVSQIIMYLVKRHGLIKVLIALMPLPFWLKPAAKPILNAVIPVIVSVIVALWKDK